MADKNEILKEIGKVAIRGVRKVGPYVLAAEVYTKIFYRHIYSDQIHHFNHEDFPNLKYVRKTFVSGNNKLTGYVYHYEKYDDTKVVVFAHGYGNGHKRYLDLIDELCKRGLIVFAYDMTAFDESEGKGIRSFPQAIIDLNNALVYARKLFGKRSIYLVGHSMGGYAVGCNLSLNDDIKKAVILSGFNKSSELVRAHGEEWIGEDAANVVKYIDAYEDAFFGKYAKMSVVNSLGKTKSECLIIHSKDDKTVPYPASFELYHKAYAKDKRFKFISYDNRGHGTIYYHLDGKKYYEEFAEKFKKYKKENPKASEAQKDEFFKNNIDYDKWLNMVDNKLIDIIFDYIKK